MEQIIPALSDLPLLLCAFVLGSVIGSFLNVCIWRLPRGESVAYPASHCPSCDAPIRFYDNVPVLSYLLLRGRCRACGVGISAQYPVVEALSGAMAALLVWNFGVGTDAAFYFVFISALIVITFIDLEQMIIPNVISLPGILVGLAFGALRTDWGGAPALLASVRFDIVGFFIAASEIPIFDSLLGAALGGGILLIIAIIYSAVRGREGLGMGDVKLLAMIGAFLGWKSIIFVTLISSLLGTVVGIGVMLYKKESMAYAIPYGPFLAAAAAAYLFFAPALGGLLFP
ncbi:MAG: prepilin peptidase [Deltaproteobacteria bacterium]